jgi:hypothetical protein
MKTYSIPSNVDMIHNTMDLLAAEDEFLMLERVYEYDVHAPQEAAKTYRKTGCGAIAQSDYSFIV